MKRDLMDILACPTCKGEFELKVEEENDQEIVRGTLTCKQCGEVYPITDTIPDLRPPSLREASGADDFEDLDDFDEEESRPIIPILLGIAAVVGLVFLALFLRGRARRQKKMVTLPVVGKVEVPSLSDVKLPQMPNLADLREQVQDLRLPPVSELRERLPDLPEVRLPAAPARRGWFRR
ncbi:MAG: methytransferase partner Trm112 [Chloroflexota bacterium]|nr:methytransferase partner Trm112 [Chloroflexota bacterium]